MQPSAPPRRGDPRVAMTWLAVILLSLAVIGVAVYKAWPLLFPDVGERAALNPVCDLAAGACEVGFAGGGSVRLDIRPRGIPVVQPLQIQVELAGLPIPERAELDFAGVDMDMGYNRVSLEPVPGRPGTFQGRGMLPICVRDRMTWEARVLLYGPEGIRAAPFRFETAGQP
jgi:hypothetical protein